MTAKSQNGQAPGRLAQKLGGTRGFCGLNKFLRAPRELRPIGRIEDLPRDKRRADADGGTAGLEEFRKIGQVHAAGGHEAQVWQGRAQSFDVAGAEGLSWENFYEVSADFMCQLRFARR